MGLFNKLMFWKKEPSLDFSAGIDTSFAPAPSPNTGLPNTGAGFGAPRFGDPTLDNSGFGAPQQDFGMPQSGFGQRPGYDQPKIISETSPGFAAPHLQRDTYDKNLEIVSMKLDNIKAALENMNQRLMNIERMATDGMREEQQRRRTSW
jgi:hypothetical protein